MKIAIIGGGASGMMAAITAAKYGAEVTLIERKDRIGKKILATGNGKCNFTNINMKATDFFSQCKGVYSDYVSQYDNFSVISFFQELGMLIKDKNGYCYPRSEQASTILDLLRLQLKSLHVTILTDDYPVVIEKKKKDFEICFNSGEKKYYQKVILCCGSYAGEKKAVEPSGYSYAKQLGHKIVPLVPALVQLRVSDKDMKTIAGVRCDARISLYINKRQVAEEVGELQLTDYGISGIPVFQLSRYASYGLYENKKVHAIIDFLPEYDMEDWMTIIKTKFNNIPSEMTIEEFLQGFLNKKLNLYFLKYWGLKPDLSLKELSSSKLQKLLADMKNKSFLIQATNPFENAQVCAGGVSMEEVSLGLESKLVDGLYFAGEMLDVDARCGGYNLQWAWSSGYIAGKTAATKIK